MSFDLLKTEFQRGKRDRQDIVLDAMKLALDMLQDLDNATPKQALKTMVQCKNGVSAITSKWLYNEFWKVKGDMLSYFLVQKLGDFPEMRILYSSFHWDIDQCKNPSVSIDSNNTIETFIFEYTDGTKDEFHVPFINSLPIQFGVPVVIDSIIYEVNWYEKGVYELVDSIGRTLYMDTASIKEILRKRGEQC